jgi:hypothetical protein
MFVAGAMPVAPGAWQKVKVPLVVRPLFVTDI